MGFAAELTVVALAALISISFFFIGLTRFLDWLARRLSKEEVEATGIAEVAISMEAEKRKRVRIAIAAVMSYLEAERRGGIRGSRSSMYAKPKSTTQEGEK
jgi:hypothetical protein